MRKVICVLVLAVMFCSVIPAAQATEQYGSIHVKLDAGEMPVINGAVTLYQVGYRIEEGYRLTERFGGGIIRLEDAHSDNLANWLAESAGDNGMTMLLDADGNAVFSDLEEGLYILVQTERIDGFYTVLPELIQIPAGEIRDIQVYKKPVPVVTEIPKTGQSPMPYLSALCMLLSGSGLLLCRKKIRD